MSNQSTKGVLISDFNLDNLAAYLNNSEDQPAVEVTPAPFGQVVQTLTGSNDFLEEHEADFALIWTLPQLTIPSFQRLAAGEKIKIKGLYEDVDQFVELIGGVCRQFKTIFIPSWSASWARGVGMLEMKDQIGMTNSLMRMNLRLIKGLSELPQVIILDSQQWLQSAGQRALNPKLWYLAKVPFGNEVFIEAQKDIKAALNALAGKTKKCVIVDLDDTLWGGVVGDEGWENLKLGGHDPVGEAYVDFQQGLKVLSRRGVILGIASKNEERTALEAITKHPAMVLKEDDFAAFAINWQDKAQNIVNLATQLNIGLDSIVFIDNSAAERDRVRQALPDVFVPDWPEDPMFYRKALSELRCFDQAALSEEDRSKTKKYSQERQRQSNRTTMVSFDEWLSGLEMVIRIEELNEANLTRAAQLMNKTNQMNLTTRRMSESELWQWSVERNHMIWTYQVADQFGDSGLVGLLGATWDAKEENVTVTDFLLSCRVMGRKIEETMVQSVLQFAYHHKLSQVIATYEQTPKNQPCLKFFSSLENAIIEGDVFTWQSLHIKNQYSSFIRVEDRVNQKEILV